jgi:hypothetical protein
MKRFSEIQPGVGGAPRSGGARVGVPGRVEMQP